MAINKAIQKYALTRIFPTNVFCFVLARGRNDDVAIYFAAGQFDYCGLIRDCFLRRNDVSMEIEAQRTFLSLTVRRNPRLKEFDKS
jgi:hypothetical protein